MKGKQKFKALRKNGVSKGRGLKLMKSYAEGPAHQMATPPAGAQSANAESEMRKLMQNKGIPRKRVVS